jgi:hypothetical protein
MLHDFEAKIVLHLPVNKQQQAYPVSTFGTVLTRGWFDQMEE